MKKCIIKQQLYKYIKEEFENYDSLKPYIKEMALDALRTLRD